LSAATFIGGIVLIATVMMCVTYIKHMLVKCLESLSKKYIE